MEKIVFLEPGRWCDDPQKPVFDVAAGDVVTVSDRTADIAINSGKAKIYQEEIVAPVDQRGKPAHEDKIDKLEKKKPGPKPKKNSGYKKKNSSAGPERKAEG